MMNGNVFTALQKPKNDKSINKINIPFHLIERISLVSHKKGKEKLYQRINCICNPLQNIIPIKLLLISIKGTVYASSYLLSILKKLNNLTSLSNVFVEDHLKNRNQSRNYKVTAINIFPNTLL
jgi:hypothetical protein